MNTCATCGHPDYEHHDIRIGSPCLVAYGVWSDWPMDWDAENCLCAGYQPEVTGACI